MSANQNQSFSEAWVRPVEQLVLPALEGRARVFGFTSPGPGVGVTTLCHAAAQTLTRCGVKVLLLDLASQPVGNGNGDRSWAPGEGGAGAFAKRHAGGYDVLTAVVSPSTRFLFNNAKRLRRTLFEDLSEYGVLIVDLPPVLDDRTDGINPVGVALVCDQVLLVCASERTTRNAARQASETARVSGVKLTGIVWNQLGAAPLGVDIARGLKRWLWIVPGLSRLIDRRIGRSTFLNS